MADPKDYSLSAESGSFIVSGFAPTIVIHGPEVSSGDTVTKVSAPGAESVARITRAGDVFLIVKGTEGIGRSGETRVAKTLAAHLQSEGKLVDVLPGADDRGEDRRLLLSSSSYNLQIVTVPSVSDFWRAARESSGSTNVPLDGAVGWIDKCIEKKAERIASVDRRFTILALDAQHANPLAEPEVVAAYLRTNGDPSDKYGFAGVWIVGSTSSQCARVGANAI